MTFNNLNDLMKFMETQIQDTMCKEVADVAVEQLGNSVKTTVYDAYKPTKYVRRYSNGGLGDIRNMEVTEVENGIEVRDVAPLDNGRTDYALDDIVVHGYDNHPFGRDFYADALDNLEYSGDAKNALKSGLKRRGINVK